MIGTWPTPHHLPEFREYVMDICFMSEFQETSSIFQHRFDYLINTSLDKIIVDVKTEKTLYKYKKKTQEHAKQQSNTRKVIAKDGVLKADEEAEQIRSRHLEEVEQAREKILL